MRNNFTKYMLMSIRKPALIIFFLCYFASSTFADWQTELKQKVKQNKPPQWMLEQISEDLKFFMKKGVTQGSLDSIMSNHNLSCKETLIKYEIKDNIVSVRKNNITDPMKIPRANAITDALIRISNCVPLPDVEFIIATEDFVTNEDNENLLAPIFVFAKNKNTCFKQALMPDFEALAGNSGFLYRTEIGKKDYPWKKKKNMAIWRGAMTGGHFTAQNFLTPPRSKLVSLSLKNPLLMNAKYNLIAQTNEPEKIKNEFSSYFGETISIEEHIQYKYQILIDGNTCAYSRAYWQLFSKCVIFKQISDNIQWFYRVLNPYEHYIPVKNDMSDLIEKIQWAQNHDKEAKKISRKAYAFAKENLKHSDVLFYLYLLLNEYKKLQK